MNSRHEARSIAFQILYRFDLDRARTTSAEETSPDPALVRSDIERHFDHFQVGLPMRDFILELVQGTIGNLLSIDRAIEEQAANWRIQRMPFVDRNLLRMAIFELRHFADIPASVTLDEAIELGKEFGTEETPGFINGILDAVAKKLGKVSPA